MPVKPVIAIVGRPNVGKSTLFNRLLGQRQALVDDRPGVTRDRHYGETRTESGREVVLIDTGGFEPEPDDDLFQTVRSQAEAAIDEADLIVFVVDQQAGLTPADRLAADILRRRAGDKADRVVLVVNKCDSPRHDAEAMEFWSLGMHPMLSISAEHGRGVWELWQELEQRLPPEPADGPEAEADEADEGEIRVAVIGRPNIGKSTLINRLLGEERQVVHDAPGTTMDSVDSLLVHEGRRYRLVDTAGVRRKARIDDRLETFASLRAIRTIERCHVCLLMIDGERGVANQDARLAALVADRGRACIVLVNRWDLVRAHPERNVRVVDDELDARLPHLSWAPRLYISALTGKGCHRILPLVDRVYAEFDKRIPTAQVNRFLEDAVAAYSPPQLHHHPVRLNYMTQTRVRPPSFVVWANTPDGVKAPYKRYLENRLRDAFGFEGTPIRLQVRRKRRLGEEKPR
ncbi:MAG: ribosome biogenesis GTPase Der [Deltaproteobacteria bacterium]|nr:MAG: ribosome biogenesis GTPase Der [Deltaproteobacteria bacterium]